MSKNVPPKGPEFSREREWTAVVEDLRSQFRTVVEGLTDVQEKVSTIPQIHERLQRVEEDVKLIKSALPNLSQEIKKIDKRLTVVESR